MTTQRFTAEIYPGHTTDCGVLVPFDPSAVWPKSTPLPIGYRKHAGHAVRGTIEGEPFESWIFHYAKAWRMVVPGPAMAAAKLEAGDAAEFVLRPHPKPATVAKFTPGPKR